MRGLLCCARFALSVVHHFKNFCSMQQAKERGLAACRFFFGLRPKIFPRDEPRVAMHWEVVEGRTT